MKSVVKNFDFLPSSANRHVASLDFVKATWGIGRSSAVVYKGLELEFNLASISLGAARM